MFFFVVCPFCFLALFITEIDLLASALLDIWPDHVAIEAFIATRLRFQERELTILFWQHVFEAVPLYLSLLTLG